MDSILIVADNRQVVQQLKETLSSWSFQVAFIPRSDYLLGRIENESFNLILLDITPPEKIGIDWLKKIKSHPAHKDLPVLIIISEDERDTLKTCFELGANDYILKPINQIELKLRIRSSIDSKKYLALKIEFQKRKTIESKMLMLSSQMNPITISNSLDSIQSYILNNDADKATNFISEFTGLMRTNLINSTAKYISIAEEIDFLDRYVSLEQIRLNNSFNYEINDKIENIYDTLIPPMLLQPFVENAIIYGLSKLKDREGVLTVVLKENTETITCSISDNGIGRENALKYRSFGHKSVTMEYLNTKIELLNSFSDKNEYTYKIIDLYDNKIAIGTKVKLSFPNDLH